MPEKGPDIPPEDLVMRRPLILETLEIRAPEKGELYLDRRGRVRRCDARWGKHCAKRLIVEEGWLEGEKAEEANYV